MTVIDYADTDRISTEQNATAQKRAERERYIPGVFKLPRQSAAKKQPETLLSLRGRTRIVFAMVKNGKVAPTDPRYGDIEPEITSNVFTNIGRLNRKNRNSAWARKARSLSALKTGWNRYAAPPPSEVAIKCTCDFLEVMGATAQTPSRVAPSVVGGIGITIRSGPRMVFVEFYNNGSVHGLFTDDHSDGESEVIAANKFSYGRFLRKVKNYLHG